MFKLNKTNESGRSMVEMLGVLAIIGVLSVMGIAGYTQAMKSYRGNEIVNATSMLYMMGQSANGGEGATADLAYTTAFGTEPSGVSSLTYKPNGTITMTISDTDICKDVKNKLGSKATGECSGNASTLTVTLVDVREEETPSVGLDNTEWEQDTCEAGYAIVRGPTSGCARSLEEAVTHCQSVCAPGECNSATIYSPPGNLAFFSCTNE